MVIRRSKSRDYSIEDFIKEPNNLPHFAIDTSHYGDNINDVVARMWQSDLTHLALSNTTFTGTASLQDELGELHSGFVKPLKIRSFDEALFVHTSYLTISTEKCLPESAVCYQLFQNYFV